MSDEAHLEAFARECEENIVSLNNALLKLEENPDNEDAIEEIFRTAHTLKGNFAAMGYESGSELAHAIEDLLDDVRQGRRRVSPELMDRVFEGVDRLEEIVSNIEADGESAVAIEPTIQGLEELLESEQAPDDGNNSETSPDNDESVSSRALSAIDAERLQAAESPILLTTVSVDSTSDMSGVDGLLALDGIRDAIPLLGVSPPESEIEAGEFDGEFDVVIEGETAENATQAIEGVDKIDDVDHVDVTDRIGKETTPEDGVDQSQNADTDQAGNTVKSVRIDVDRLDELYGLVEQLVTGRIKLSRAIDDGDIDAAEDSLDDLDKTSSNLQNVVMEMRLIPLEKVVNTFPRMVRDLAREQGKKVDFEMTGTDVELDRTILDAISDPLLHILRNAVDHGIEPPEEREAAGKPVSGVIQLSAARESDYVEITVDDDGRGLDVDSIRQKAISKGIHTEVELEAMSEGDIQELIFHPGFSTNEEVTDVSGRGVGMDVVASTVERLDGTVSVDSTPGKGSTIQIRLPVSVAIVRVLFVEVGNQQFGIPIKAIDEVTQVSGVETIEGTDAVEHDGSIYPIIDLAASLDIPSRQRNGDGMLIHIREQERQAALRCRAVNRQEEVVIKPLDGELRDVPGLGGTAVIGDGQVIPIIDVKSLGGPDIAIEEAPNA